MPITSPRWSDNGRLQAASDNKPSMKQGERDRPAVKLLQEVLIEQGFPIAAGATGNYQSQTAAAVQAVEKRFHLKHDSGIAGRQVLTTLDALLLGITPPAPTPTPVTGKALAQTDVPLAARKLRHSILALNLFRGTLVTGDFGVVGPVDALTLAALRVHFRLVDTGPPLPHQRVLTVADIDLLISTFTKISAVLDGNATTFKDGTTQEPHVAEAPFGGQIAFGPNYRGGEPPDPNRIGPNSRAAILIHEGTHVVDNQSGDDLTTHISEFSTQYDVQSADFSLHNPSSYAAFAAHVFSGSVAERKPRFGLDGGPGQFL